MVAVFVLDRQRRCNYLNRIAELLVGQDSGEVRNRRFDEVVSVAAEASFAATRLGQAVLDDAGGAGEDCLVDRLGVERPVSFRVEPLLTAGGDLHGIVVELIDLTGETGAGRAIRESEERLRLAVAATGIGIWDVNVVSGRRRWSPEFFEILGLPPDGLADYQQFAALIHPDDRERVIRMYERSYAKGGAPDYHAEFRIRRADDGSERWVVATGTVMSDAAGRPVRGVGTLRDITERRIAQERMELLLGELNHRVKNLFALVQAVVSQTFRTVDDPGDAYPRIEARLHALSAAHDLLVGSHWTSASLAELLHAGLAPHLESPNRVHLAGEPVRVAPSAALSLALVIHELATNATKYGSLSVSEGRLDVAWSVEPRDGVRWVAIDWRERGGPPAAPPVRQGFGSRLIARSVESGLRGEVALDYGTTGFACRMAFPIDA